ncbi:hypothetical protein BGV47_25230 [Burkholderia ubonensis]|nr:hypothetical protein BGV47_25230 [Burkholderia ubonensis]OJB29189.1 hypothetical protein BGV55_16500 [Burkholderia ubonensis]
MHPADRAEPIVRAFAFGGVPVPRDAGVDSVDRIDVDEHDGIVQRLHIPQTQTAWNVARARRRTRAFRAGTARAA